METDGTLQFFFTPPTGSEPGKISLRKRNDGEDNVPLAFLHVILTGSAFQRTEIDTQYVVDGTAYIATFITYNIRGTINFYRLVQQMRVGYGALEVEHYEAVA